MSSSSTTTTTKTAASVKPKATPNSGSYTVKIPTSAELSLALKKLWNGSYEDGPHRKLLEKVAKEHEQWMATLSRHSGILEDMEGEMKPVLVEMLMALMAFMDGTDWWLLPTCFDMKGNTSIPFDCDDLVSLIDDLKNKGIDVEDGDALAVLLYELGLYRDDMYGVVDSRKVLQAALELIEAGKADDAMVQLYNNLTGYANDHDFPDTELGEALNDPTEHPGVKLPVIKTSNGLLWCDVPDALPMVVLYKDKRYDAGPFKMSKLPLDVLEDPVDTHGKASDANGSSSSKPKSVAPDALEQLRQRAWKFFKTMLDAYKLEHGKYPSEEGDSWYLFVDKLIASGHFQSLDEFKQIMGQVMKWGVLSGALDDRNMYEETPHEYPFWVGHPEEFHTLLKEYDNDEYRRYAMETGTAEVDGIVSIPSLPYLESDLYICGAKDFFGATPDQVKTAQLMSCARQRAKNLANGFQFHEERREKPLKRSASDSNGASRPLKRSKSMNSNGATMPALKRSKSMDSNRSSMPALKRSKSVVAAEEDH